MIVNSISCRVNENTLTEAGGCNAKLKGYGLSKSNRHY